MNPVFNLYKNAYTGLPRQVWELAGVQFINRAGSMVIVYLMLYLTQDIGISVTAAGRIISVYGVGAIFGTMLGGYLTDEIGPMRVQLFSLLGAGLVFISLSFVTNVWGITILIFLLALIAEGFRPANSTAAADVSPPALRPRAFAIALGYQFGICDWTSGWRHSGALQLHAAVLGRWIDLCYRRRIFVFYLQT